MKTVFVIRNHHGQFLGKQGQWIDESEPAAAWRSPHRDVALNHLIETNARDIEQRLLLLQCPMNLKDIPLLGDAAPPGKSAPVTFDEPEEGIVVAEAEAEAEAVDNDRGEQDMSDAGQVAGEILA
jgi:hypothetical protein